VSIEELKIKAMTGNSWESFWIRTDNHDWWERPAPEVIDFIETQSPTKRPKVLDLGCGLGRHAIAFAKKGFCVTATDVSKVAIAHLRQWALTLELPIEAEIVDILDKTLPANSFDIVLSYNVIYHGYREQFAMAIEHVRDLLKSGGLLFFTCPTRQDGKYGFGEQVAPHTFRCTKSVIPGDLHYFADEKDLDDLLTGFLLRSRRKDEGYWDNEGVRQFYSNWIVLAEKL
jgi:SAM-dependent methyltransferase